jgi:hypothetical protein
VGAALVRVPVANRTAGDGPNRTWRVHAASRLVIFFGLLGGAAAFGLIGLVIGPIILVMTDRILTDLHYPDRLARSVRRKERMVAAGGG